MARSLLLALALLGLVAGAAAPRGHALQADVQAGPIAPVLGVAHHLPRATLAWFDPLTLATLPGRKVPLEAAPQSWAFSVDRSILALGSCGDRGALASVMFVNARSMRPIGVVSISPYRGCVDALVWLRADRLLALVHVADLPELVVIDPLARRIVRREQLPSWAWVAGTTAHEVVFVYSNYGAIAATRLALVDGDGRLRTVVVERILQGTVADEGSGEESMRTVQPGVAVDSDDRRAFLVPTAGPLAAVDLAEPSVSYHELDRPSLLTRFLRWLTPAAQAKGRVAGPVREARWLGGGMIALSGADFAITRTARDQAEGVAHPAGLVLIDTRTWRAQMLSSDASEFAVSPGLVIAQGEGRAFGLDGRERWRLPGDERRWVFPAGQVGHAHTGAGRADVVDLATGAVLGRITRDERRRPWPQLLVGQSSSP